MSSDAKYLFTIPTSGSFLATAQSPGRCLGPPAMQTLNKKQVRTQIRVTYL